jgi:hypothetical protein
MILSASARVSAGDEAESEADFSADEESEGSLAPCVFWTTANAAKMPLRLARHTRFLSFMRVESGG